VTTIQTTGGTLEAAFVYHPGDGADLYSVAKQVAIVASTHKRPVTVVYNGITMICRPGVTADDLIKIYWTRKN